MRFDKQFNEVTKEEEKKYVLCYIEEVPHTFFDLDPHSMKLVETPAYKKYAAKKKEYFDDVLAREHSYSSYMVEEYNRIHDPEGNFRLDYCDYPHPDYVEGYTHYFYFTDNMSKQWGDDWNDAPYEHNAGEPYDDDTNIIRIPVRLTYKYLQSLINDEDDEDYDKNMKIFNKMIKKYKGYNDNCVLQFPNDNFLNSPYCVDDINHGAVAWLFFAKYDYGIKEAVAIYGGDSIKVVNKKLKAIEKLLKTTLDKK